MKVVHITPSGAERTLCGLRSSDVESSSLGTVCTCDECYSEGERILRRKKEQ